MFPGDAMDKSQSNTASSEFGANRRARTIAVVGSGVLLALLASFVYFAARDQGSQSNASSQMQAVASSAPIDASGSSGIADSQVQDVLPAGALGSRDNPITSVSPITARAMIAGVPLSVASSNLCADIGISTYGTEFSQSGVAARYVGAHFVDVPGTEPVLRTLVCSTLRASIPPSAVGPGPEGASLPCPTWARRVRSGSGSVYFESSTTGGSAGNVSQFSGIYKSDSDGLWNMKFANSNTELHIIPVMWMVCE